MGQSSEIPIAIIGMGCRLPGNTTSPDKLWKLCAEGRSAWSKIPRSRFNQESFYHPNGEKVGTSNVLGGYFLNEDPAVFDAFFFGFTAEAAETLDPQVRLQLECVYEAMESAGISLEKIAGSDTSVYAGAFFRDYHDSLMRDPEQLPRFLMTGNGAAMSSNRISHFYDLRGPSMTLDTGCSTTLTALHVACQNLKDGESSMSVITGANLMLNPDMFISMSSLGLLGPDGKSYAFDSRANGYGRGEGIAAIIIKRLDDAIRDGDPIRAVIRQSAVNQDGKTSTLTSPSQESQEALTRECYRRAGLDPAETAYLEAHGTGTPVGDPIEIRAAAAVFAKGRSPENPLRIGSLKTNIGHTEATSGLASVIKVTLALEKGIIPPSINFENPNPKIDLDAWNLRVAREAEDWPSVNGFRRASVNNFGYGGANVHVIMENFNPAAYYPKVINGSSAIGNNVGLSSWVIPVSAKDEGSALAIAKNLKGYIKNSHFKTEDEHDVMRRIAHTLGSRRSVLPWASAHAVSSLQDLSSAIEEGKFKPVRSLQPTRLGFVFTGQGAQWYAMGRELIEAYPEFRAGIEEAEECLKSLGCNWSVIEELSRDASDSRVNEMTLSLPLCTTIQLSLVRLLRSFDITPAAVTGHSSGEVAAAYAAGALSFKSALAITFFRGALGSEFDDKIAGKGGMIAVGLGPEETNQRISRLRKGKVVLGCINSQSSVTVSGDLAAIAELEEMLEEEKVFARRVKVEAAYHSHHMKAIEEEYLASLSRIVAPNSSGEWGSIVYSSPTTGGREDSIERIGSAHHWVCNMLQPVRFAESFQNMCFSPDGSQDVDIVIEVGPHGALKGPIQQLMALPRAQSSRIPYMSCLTRGTSAIVTIQDLASQLFRIGYKVNMSAVNGTGHGVKTLHDLPPYPWNHETAHWLESRINADHRKKQFPSHDLLGNLALGTNMLAPTWRHIIRPNDLPWVRDHTVQSEIVYPGAGFICMAVEAISQLVALRYPGKPATSFRLADIDISKALVVPDTSQGIETQISLRPQSKKLLSTHEWYEFSICSAGGGTSWTEHCRGRIAADFKSPASGTPPPVAQLALARLVDPNDMFAAMRSVGIFHGPIFRNMSAIQSSKGRSVSHFSIADTSSAMPHQFQSKHVLHPTTLDSVLQAAYTALPGAGVDQESIMLPRSIRELWIDSSMDSAPGHRFRADASLVRSDSQGFEANISVSDSSTVISLHGLKCQSLGQTLTHGADPSTSDLCFTMEWAPDMARINSGLIKERLANPLGPDEADIILDLRQACLYYIRRALSSLNEADMTGLEKHQRKFYDWMLLQVQVSGKKHPARDGTDWLAPSAAWDKPLLARVREASVNGEMVTRVGEKLIEILRHEVTPLELMLEGQLLYRYYNEAIKWSRSYRQMASLVQLFAHKRPDATILEIGAGTGGCTREVLAALASNAPGPRCARYDYTDISSGFFNAARQEFALYEDFMRFRKLNIEGDIQEQGFETGTYDFIVASQVLHATKTIRETMRNVRSLLKPGGKLLLVETTRDEIDLQFIFGLLPGWWLSTEYERRWSPSLSVPMWDTVLKDSGFDGVSVELRDCEDEQMYSFSVMMATAIQPRPAIKQDVAIVYTEPAPPPQWMKQLQASLLSSGVPDPRIMSPGDDVSGKLCIFVGEMDKAILNNPDPESFHSVKMLSTRASGVLWVSRGGAVDCERPQSSLNTGFLRCLRSEYPEKRLITLDLDPMAQLWTTEAATTVTEVFHTSLIAPSPNDMEFEFAERNGELLIPRMYRDTERNEEIAAKTKRVSTRQPLQQPGRLVRMEIGCPGLLDTLQFTSSPLADVLPDEDCVEIEPRAFGLNFRDVMVALGQLDESVMGFEAAGVVRRLGHRAARRGGLRVGDRVCALLRGHWASHVYTHWHCVARLPDAVSFEVGASIPMAFVTAHVALHDAGRLARGDKVLVHAAAGGVGQAAVILAQHFGAEVLATAGSEAKRQLLVEEFGIRPEHIFSSRDESFAEGVRRATGGRGVDVVVNSLAGGLLQAGFDCLADFGRFVEIGKRDIETGRCLDMSSFARSTSFAAVDLIALGRQRSEVIHSAMTDVMRILNRGEITTVRPMAVHKLDELESMFRVMQSGKHSGKIIFSIPPDTLVPVVPQPLRANLRPDASYMIVGGMGGIGKSLCKWFVEHGATSLVIASRNAGVSKANQDFINELRQAPCAIHVINVDISDESQLKTALNECEEDICPIRGIIHAGMVLRDSILEHMDFDSYQTALQPKVRGSANLHQYFSDRDIDFFIMLSSLTGVAGSASQANYGAGGSFQDALARHRRARGQPATSIDLGVVKSVGYVAENRGIAERLVKMGFRLIGEDEVLRVVETAIAEQLPHGGGGPVQIITGVKTAAGPHWNEQPWLQDARFSALRGRRSGAASGRDGRAAGGSGDASDVGVALAAAETMAAAVSVTQAAIVGKLSNMCFIPADEIVLTKPPADYGVDSLVAVELRTWLATQLGSALSVFEVIQSSSLAALASLAVARSNKVTLS